MSKKKRMNNKKQNTSESTIKTFDEKTFAHGIIKAHEEYEHHKMIEKEKEDKKRQDEWLKILNQKEYPSNEKWIWRKWHKFRNDFFF